MAFSPLGIFAGCTSVPATVESDSSLEFVERQGYKFHVRTYGDKSLPPVIVVRGGQGGDSKYIYPIQDLAKNHYVIFYDQRGTGLSPRVNQEVLTLESSLDDLHSVVSHYGGRGQVRLIGHSWGGIDLTRNVAAYQGKLLMLSSECSFIGYKFQREFYMPSLPAQTVHLEAKAMGHNMLTLNPAWSVAVISRFFHE